jgi:SAM-dependent methyltransferase
MGGVQEDARDRVTPWYVDSFDRDYLARYAHRDDQEAASDVASIEQLLGLSPQDQVLDLACGAGRHLLALHRAGFSALTGLDLSQPLLDVARRRLDEAGAHAVELIRSDMRRIPLRAAFDTILSLFTSFGYFATDAENERVLQAVWDALRPGGMLLIDTLNAPATRASLIRAEEFCDDRGDVCISRNYDPDLRRVDKVTHIRRPGLAPRRIEESVRVYDGDELSGALHRHGFGHVACYGSLDGAPYGPASPRLVAVGRKPQR